MKGTIRIDEMPKSMFEMTDTSFILKQGETRSIVKKELTIPEELKHVPFKELIKFESSSPSSASIDSEGIVKAVAPGTPTIFYKVKSKEELKMVLGDGYIYSGGLDFNFSQSKKITILNKD